MLERSDMFDENVFFFSGEKRLEVCCDGAGQDVSHCLHSLHRHCNCGCVTFSAAHHGRVECIK